MRDSVLLEQTPGANPVDGRDRLGMEACADSVSKIPYADCQDGISLTETVVPHGLGAEPSERVTNLVATLDGLFERGLFHVNVHVPAPVAQELQPSAR